MGEKECIRSREWYQKNKHRLRGGKTLTQYARDRRQGNIEIEKSIIQSTIRWQKRNPLRYWSNQTIHSHKRREKVILLTRVELEDLAKRTEICWICGERLEYMSSTNKGNFKYSSASLDIIDISKPATRENVQIICNHCNICKGTFNMAEFLSYCKNVSCRNA